MKRQRSLERLRAVEREYLISSLALKFLKDGIAVDPAVLAIWELRQRDVARFEENQENTYLIRLFAVFESTLRDLWIKGFHRKSEPPVRDLVDSLAARRGGPDEAVHDVHSIRSYRNAFVHDGAEVDGIVSIADGRSVLAKFLAHLPLDW